jgi:hypothetical protein
MNVGKSNLDMAVLNSRPAWKASDSPLYQQVQNVKYYYGNSYIYNKT